MNRPVEYKNGGENKPRAIKLPHGWTVSGPVPDSESLFSDAKLTEIVKKWSDMQSYGTLLAADKRTKEDNLLSAVVNSTIKFNGDR